MHTDLECSILSIKYNPDQPLQKPGFKKKIRTITGGPWWTQIKVALIQKGLLDNQNPGFYMGWPGLYLMDSIEHSRSVCNDQMLILGLSHFINV